MTDQDDRQAGASTERSEPLDGDFYRQVVSAANEAVITTDADGTIVYANEAVEELLGYAPSDLRGRSFADFVPDRVRERYERWFDRCAGESRGTPFGDESFEVTGKTAADTERRISVSAFAHGTDERRLFTGFVREAPDGRSAGERLREEKALIEELFRTSPSAIAVWNEEGELVRANRRSAELAGLDPEGRTESETAAEIAARVERDLDVGTFSAVTDPIERVIRTGEPLDSEELVLEQGDGDRRYLSISAAPIYEDGEVETVVSAAEDVTELKRTQLRLETRRNELETELSEIFDRITDAFFALDDDWEFTYVNEEAEALLGRSREELLGEHIWDEFSEAANTTFQREYERAMETQESVSFVEYYPPLETWFEVRAHPSETGLSAYFRDVSDRVDREQELERYETIVETVDDGLYVVGPDGTLSMVNSAFAETLGYDREELIGMDPSGLYDEEVRSEVAQLQAEILDGQRRSATVEHEIQAGDRDPFPVETTFVVRETEDSRHERVGVMRDVAERKERERALRERNERLDAFASMLAHELRNPLEIAQIYLDGVGDGDPEAFEEVERALDRIEEMIDTLLVVTRRGGAVDATDAVDLGETARAGWRNVDVEGTFVVETDRTVAADRPRLRQLLENLFHNAVEHGAADRRSDGSDERDVTIRVDDFEDGFYVEDDGPGIPEADRERVFELGHSTSNVGIGFGLAVVRQLAEAHGWEYAIAESAEGGARFEFTGVETAE